MVTKIPGVYTTEIDQSTYVRNASTLAVGIVGEATYGPLDNPQFIADEGQFIDMFGVPNPSCIGMYGALMYLKSGSKLWYARVAPTKTAGAANVATKILVDSDAPFNFKFGATDDGTNITIPDAFYPKLVSNLAYEVTGTSTKVLNVYYKGVLAEAISGASDTLIKSINTTKSAFIVADHVLDTEVLSTIAIVAKTAAAPSYDFASNRYYDSVSKAASIVCLYQGASGVEYSAAGAEGITSTSYYIPAFALVAKYYGTDGNNISYAISNVKQPVPGNETFTLTINFWSKTEVFKNVSINPKATLTAGVTHISDIVSTIVDVITLPTYTKAAASGKITDSLTAPTTPFLTGSLEGGLNGSVVDSGLALQAEFTGDIIGVEADDTGLKAFYNTTEYNIGLVLVPKYSAYKSVAAALAELCETRQDCMFILDPPQSLTTQEVVDWANGAYTE